jgi:hypothetical protein
MNSIQEQYEAAGTFRDRLRAGLPTGDSGGPAPSSADHALLAAAEDALTRPNISPDFRARLIREAALLESCRYCGEIYKSDPAGFGPMCDCPENDR